MRCATLLVPLASAPVPDVVDVAGAGAGAAPVPHLVRALHRHPRVEHVSVVERSGGVVAFVCWTRGRPDRVAEQLLHDDLCAALLATGVTPLALGPPPTSGFRR